MAGSTAAQAAVVVALVVVSAVSARRPVERLVPVTIARHREALPGSGPLPPPPRAPSVRSARPPATEPARPRPPSPQPVTQPRQLSRAPISTEPPDLTEAEADESSAEPGGTEDGSPGGIVGGAVGGTPGGPGTGISDDAPLHAAAGFRVPREARSGCLASSIRIPPALRGFVSGRVVVKFAVGRDGQVSLFQVLSGAVADPRVAEAIWRGVQDCEWLPGADAQGKLARIWVIQPVRFSQR